MREIKFRAWQKQPCLHRPVGMYVVNDIVWYDKPHDGNTGEVFFRSYTSSEFLEDVELMQYTGLKDKNGVEIYEGDIVKTTIKATPVMSIVWDEGTLSWGLVNPTSGHKAGDGYLDATMGWLEVIGNIYEKASN